MKNIVLFAIAVLFLTSCSQRWCNTRYPVQSDTIRLETIRDSIILKDTTVYVHIQGTFTTDSVIIPCPEVPGYVPQKVCKETDFASACAWWSYPTIKLELIQKDTTLAIRLENAIKEAYYYKTLYEKVHIIKPPEKYIPQIYKSAMSIVITIFAGVFVFMGYKIYKFFR